jgi:hypothetical protein
MTQCSMLYTVLTRQPMSKLCCVVAIHELAATQNLIGYF